MAVLMNKAQSKHYSLLLQDEADPNEHILRIRNEKMTISDVDDDDDQDDDQEDDDDDDDGFKSMIGEDEEQDVEDDGDEDDLNGDEVEGSDEEIFSSNQHRALTNDNVRHCGPPSYGRNNDYHLLSNESDHKGNAFDGSLNAIWTPTPMSPVRRAFFLASIMFGVLVVAMFLWALPCDVQPCESELKIKPRQWFTEIDHIGVNYTQLLEKINGHLSLFASFYKVEDFTEILHRNGSSSASLEPKMNITPANCGLLSLDEKMGKQSWKVDLLECPRHINCELLDATGDGLPDCLILGHTSMALIFEPIYGTIFWHLHVHKREEVSDSWEFDPESYRYDIPLVLQDLNGDGFSELLFPVTRRENISLTKDAKRVHLLLVSGRTGAILGDPITVANCFKIIQVFREDDSVGYSCMMDNRSELTGKIPLSTLLSELGRGLTEGSSLRNETFFFDLETTPESNDAVCQIRHSVEGMCPYCKARIEFGLVSDNPINRDYEYTSVVSWKVLASNNVCKGAVMKLWKWDPGSLEAAFQEGASTTTLSTGTADEGERGSSPSPALPREGGFKLGDPSAGGETYYDDDSEDLSPTFSGDKFPFGDTYPFAALKRTDEGKGVPPFGRREPRAKDRAFPKPMEIHPKKENGAFAPLMKGNHRTKRFYEHQTIHQHTKDMTTSASSSHSSSDDAQTDLDIPDTPGTKSSTPDSAAVTAPTGFRLQKLEEVLILLTFNGTEWVTRELGSMAVFQLCQQECIPSHYSQKESDIGDSEVAALMCPGGLRVPMDQLAVLSGTSVPDRATQGGEATGERLPKLVVAHSSKILLILWIRLQLLFCLLVPVLVDENSLRFDDWNLYVSSTSFSSLREERGNATSVTWSLESYVRKLITPAGVY